MVVAIWYGWVVGDNNLNVHCGEAIVATIAARSREYVSCRTIVARYGDDNVDFCLTDITYGEDDVEGGEAGSWIGRVVMKGVWG